VVFEAAKQSSLALHLVDSRHLGEKRGWFTVLPVVLELRPSRSYPCNPTAQSTQTIVPPIGGQLETRFCLRRSQDLTPPPVSEQAARSCGRCIIQGASQVCSFQAMSCTHSLQVRMKGFNIWLWALRQPAGEH
jgi:hypothetical protein